MAGTSSIKKLDPAVRGEVDAAIKRGATIDQIVQMLRGLGADVSRSAVGRYSKDYAALAARQRDIQATARAFAAEFGDADDRQSRLLIQLVTTIATNKVMPMAGDDDAGLDGKELHYLARAVKDITSAAKTDTDRERAIRADAAKTAREQAATDAASEAKAAGASDETIDRIKRKILGIDA